MRKLTVKEGEIVKAIKDYLGYLELLHKIYFVRVGTGSFKAVSGHWFRTGKTGCPDFIVCKDGKFIGLEVKTDEGEQSSEQKIAEASIMKCGGKYFVVRSVDEVRSILE